MVAVSRTVSSAPSDRAAHFAALDPLLDGRLGYALMSLFEHHAPGITESALVWAELHRLDHETVLLEKPRQSVLRIKLRSGGMVDIHRSVP